MRSAPPPRPLSLRPSWTLAVAVALALGSVLVPVGNATGIASSAPSSVSLPALVLVHPGLSFGRIAFPPVHAHPLGLTAPATVNPTGLYSSEPAPMGVGDFGVGAGGTPYTYSTSEFLGNFSWQSLNLQQSGNTYFSDQLNVVLQFVQDGIIYAYWIQDVAIMNTATNELTFENNIWNFTSSCFDNTGVIGNGTVTPYSGCQGYYAASASTQPGADRFMPNPGDFGLLVRSYENGQGLPEVAFEYWDGVTSWYVTYDNVAWPWAKAVSADHNFVVDGYQYNPLGLFYDAELIMGGPGSGAATLALSVTHATSRLLYWNGHNFEAPPSVWNFGSNTAEAVSSIQSIFSNDPGGLPLTVQLNGTTRNATPAKAYDQDRVGELVISAPGITKGTVAIPADTWAFVNGSATLTLTPGTYRVWVNSSLGPNDFGSCVITAGSALSATVGSGCAPTVSTPTASTGGADVGQAVTFHTTLISSGSGGDTYVWRTDPAGLGCPPSTSTTLSCAPAAAGTYHLNVTVTDSWSRSSTSGILSFTVSSDPAVAALASFPASIDTGQTLHFTATGVSGGTGSYRYLWSGLPTGCITSNTSTLDCHPSGAGSGTVELLILDTNGGNGSATASFQVLVDPSLAGISVSRASADVGQGVTFSVEGLTGGTGSYSYRWTGLPVGCASVNASTLVCLPTAAGTGNPAVNVIDTNGVHAAGSVGFTVYSVPIVNTPTALPGTVGVDQSVTFSVSATGGSGTLTYTWTGLPTGCTSLNASTVTCRPTASGTAQIAVDVTDSNGRSARSGDLSFTVSVPATFLGLPGLEGFALLGGLVVLGVVGGSLIAWRAGRRRSDPPP